MLSVCHRANAGEILKDTGAVCPEAALRSALQLSGHSAAACAGTQILIKELSGSGACRQSAMEQRVHLSCSWRRIGACVGSALVLHVLHSQGAREEGSFVAVQCSVKVK